MDVLVGLGEGVGVRAPAEGPARAGRASVSR